MKRCTGRILSWLRSGGLAKLRKTNLVHVRGAWIEQPPRFENYFPQITPSKMANSTYKIFI